MPHAVRQYGQEAYRQRAKEAALVGRSGPLEVACVGDGVGLDQEVVPADVGCQDVEQLVAKACPVNLRSGESVSPVCGCRCAPWVLLASWPTGVGLAGCKQVQCPVWARAWKDLSSGAAIKARALNGGSATLLAAMAHD
jgi:hypothetical protein